MEKTKLWNAAGIRPAICDVLERVAQEQNPSARVWRGAGIPVEQQGIKILGTPLGHPAHVQRFLNSISEEHQTLLRRIPLVGDVQAAWLLVVHCAGARTNYTLRCVDPEAVEPFARRHDQDMLQCLSSILRANLPVWDMETKDTATLPMSLGGLGRTPHQQVSPLGKLGRLIHERHPAVAAALVAHLENPGTPCLQAVASAARDLTGVGGFEPPWWRKLVMWARPEPREPEDFEPGTTRDGWQLEAASHVEEAFRAESLFPRMCDSRKALTRSQGGPGAGLALSSMPCQPTDHVLFTAFPGRLAASLAPSSYPHRAQLPVWRST